MKRLYVIIDWQNEDNMGVIRNCFGETLRFERIEDATSVLITSAAELEHSFLKIVEI